MKKCLWFLFLVLVPGWARGGTAHYCDLDATSNGAGTAYTSPFTYAQVLAKSNWATGDDLYFKAGSTWTLTATNQAFAVDWTGTEGDRVIIGAYDPTDGSKDLGGYDRPVFDGDNRTYPSGHDNMFGVSGTQQYWDSAPCPYNYITFENLRIQNTYGELAIGCSGPDYIIVRNCSTYQTYGGAIGLLRSHDSIIENNIVERSHWGSGRGGTIETGSNDQCDFDDCSPDSYSSYNVIIRGNLVMDCCNESIGVNKGAYHTLVEDNTIIDSKNIGIYLDSGAIDCIVRNNLIYATPNAGYWGAVANARTWQGIQYYTETERCEQYGFTPANIRFYHQHHNGPQIYGNFIAGVDNGISVGYEWEGTYDASCNPLKEYVLIENNTVVDCNTNFNFPSVERMDYFVGNTVRNNISVIYTATSTKSGASKHISHNDSNGITFNKNIYYSTVIAAPTGDAATGMLTGNPLLAKTSGWRNLEVGELTKADFAIANGSAAKNAAVANTTVSAKSTDQLTMGTSSFWFGADHFYDTAEFAGDTLYDDDGYSATIDSVDSTTKLTISGTDKVQITASPADGLYIRAASGVLDIGAWEFDETPDNRPPSTGIISVQESTP